MVVDLGLPSKPSLDIIVCHLRLFPHALIHVFILEHALARRTAIIRRINIFLEMAVIELPTLQLIFQSLATKNMVSDNTVVYVMHADWVFVDKEGLGAQSAHPMAKTM